MLTARLLKSQLFKGASTPNEIGVFSTKDYDKDNLEPAFGEEGIKTVFLDVTLTDETLLLAKNFAAVCVFVNDSLTSEGIELLAKSGLKFILLRCAGYNNVDIDAANRCGVKVARVPAYSPYAVGEFAVGSMLMLNRKFHKAYSRVREANFSLEGLTGFDMHGKTIGIVGTGKIGIIVGRICKGFGMTVICYDTYPEREMAGREGFSYVDTLDEMYTRSDIISLHCPLNDATHHMINQESLTKMKNGVMLINTSRGGLIDTTALIKALKTGHVGSVALDVYENEAGMYFQDSSNNILQDDTFSRMLTFHNVFITGHQAFLTEEALQNIATVTAKNAKAFFAGTECENIVKSSSG